jgi:hypothetical protein
MQRLIRFMLSVFLTKRAREPLVFVIVLLLSFLVTGLLVKSRWTEYKQVLAAQGIDHLDFLFWHWKL